MTARRPVRSVGALVAALMVGVLFSAGAQASAGDLDLTFSGDGKQRTDFGFGPSEAAATVLQPDGKIIAVGTSLSSFPYRFALARYNADGSLDTSFSGDGKQTTDFGPNGGATGVALQADGKIVVVGGTLESDFAVARYNPNGSLDTSFSGDGKQTTDFGGREGARGVAVQADGKIVVAGTSSIGPGGTHNGNFALARYNPNGSLDTSFSGDGEQTTIFDGDDQANGVALQADGKIVAVGFGGAFGDFVLARYNTNGSLDTSFSGDGKQKTDFANVDGAGAVAIQADGKIVAVGGTGDDFALARYNPNGTLDTSFSSDGLQTTDFGGGAAANGVALQTDGKIVAVGGAANFALARYNTDGSLDTTFSGDGMETTDFAGSDTARGVALQTDGKIVAVGALDTSFLGFAKMALARYDADGSLDTSFSGDGKQTTSFPGVEHATGVAIQADGKIVTVGFTEPINGNPEQNRFALARFNPDGSPDTSFSGDGKLTTPFGGGAGAHGVAIQADGKIVAVGEGWLARYNADGSLDTSFSGDGKQTTGFGAAAGVALQADGKIVAVGEASATGDFALARYNPNGSLDTSFSGDGKQTTDFGGDDRARAVAIRADGKIVAVGEGAGFTLARYNADGSLDTSFSGDGKQTAGGTFESASGVALQTSGKIVTVGAGADDFALARFNANGSLDTSFSGDGKQTTDFGGFEFTSGVALPGNGKIVAVGDSCNGAFTNCDFALARYNADGSLDTSFSGDGGQKTNFGGVDVANGVALQPDGKIVAVGDGLGTDGATDFALARYLGG